jgi:DNA-binding response OmpR family regulator
VKVCFLVTSEESRARRWTRLLRSEGWRVERRAGLAELQPQALGRPSGVALIDLASTRPRPAAAVSRLREVCPGWRFALVAEASDAFGSSLTEALDSGADDVISAGLEDAVFAARVEALSAGKPAMLASSDGRLRLDRDRRQAWAMLSKPKALSLTRTEFELLAVLLERRGSVVARGELIERVWPGQEVNGETVDRHIGSLRRKLASLSGLIRTSHGTGYAAA